MTEDKKKHEIVGTREDSKNGEVYTFAIIFRFLPAHKVCPDSEGPRSGYTWHSYKIPYDFLKAVRYKASCTE